MAPVTETFRDSPAFAARIKWHFAAMSLATRFAAAGSVVLLVGAAVIGVWVTDRIRTQVTENTAQASALFMDSFISPLAQELADGDALSAGPTRALEEMMDNPSLAGRVVAVKIWRKGGIVSWASDPDLIGRRFEPTASLKAAWAGQVVAEYDDLSEAENEADRAIGAPLLEIYSPLREQWTGDVIAVAEFYENAAPLESALASVQRQSWLMVIAVTGAMALSLFGIVAGCSRLIERQRGDLTARNRELERIAAQNRDLRQRIERASARAAELNEQYLRRISADLHDGPAQLVSLAALRLDSLRRLDDPARRERESADIRSALGDAMTEIRAICSGLALPDIDAMPLRDIAARVAATHEERTRFAVRTEIEVDQQAEARVSPAIRICVFRLIQEGLTNAFRHAGGNGQAVRMAVTAHRLDVAVEDDGADIGAQAGDRPIAGGLGLAGLRERVESLGGQFEAGPRKGGGFRLAMRLPLESGESK
ncbi:MAG TPA: sensor histidine kinase [Rhizobiaceae bacterium]|nr:sensor histidine kinase [Rhizobiaceae bacterium]